MKMLLAVLLAAQAQSFDPYVEQALKDWGCPGVAIAVVKDGKVVAAKGYGVRELGTPEKVDENTIFDIASLSKSFTAAAAATLVDEGKMRWDDPVIRHLPGFELPDAARTQSVTMRDLLAHRVGLEPGNWMFRITRYDKAEVLRRLRYLKEQAPLRTGMTYSNVLYLAAGEAAAHTAGMSYEELVRTRLIEPLGMKSTTVGVPHDQGTNFARSHGDFGGVVKPMRTAKAMNILPAGGLNANAVDMAKWLLFQLGDGTWEGKRIVSAAQMEEMHEPQTIIATTPRMRAGRGFDVYAGYGLGWQTTAYHGRRMLWHSGSADGMPVYMAIMPEDHVGVFVATNTWTAPTLHGALASRILDELLGFPPRDWSKESLEGYRRGIAREQQALADVEKARVPGTSPSRPLDAYAGTYVDPLYGELTIRREGEGLTLQFARGEVADLTHWQNDTFRVTWREPVYRENFSTYAAFSIDPKGVVKRLEMRLNRDDVTALRQ
jgi:CubicO group peptidase (beta-lactamase class C family)